MKNHKPLLFKNILLLCICLISIYSLSAQSIRINQLGYLPLAEKLAVMVDSEQTTFQIIDESTNTSVLNGNLTMAQYWANADEQAKIADFSSLNTPGRYHIVLPDGLQSYSFSIDENIFQDLSKGAIKAFYYNRASIEIVSAYAGVYARAMGFPDDQVQVHPSAASVDRPAGTVISTPKGWFDAADYNKYVTNSGISVFTLLAAYENYPDYYNTLDLNIPESSNAIPDILDEALWNIEWMSSMQDPHDGGVYFKTSNTGFGGVYMPANATSWNGTRYVVTKTTQSTLDFAAIMAMAARIYEPYLPVFASECLAKAEFAWQWAQANPDIRSTEARTNPVAQDGFPAVATGGYADTDAPTDEFFWAGAELYITTNNTAYLTALNYSQSFGRPSWRRVQTLGLLSLIRHKDLLDVTLQTQVMNLLLGAVDPLVTNKQNSPYRITFDTFGWGSNSNPANDGVMLMQVYEQTGDERYFQAAVSCLDYILGRNATDYSFITAYGTHSPTNIQHRISGSDGVDEPVPGLMAGGPNPYNTDLDCPDEYTTLLPAKCYVDVYCSYTTNEVAINWNSPLAYLVGAIQRTYLRDFTVTPTMYTLTVNATNGSVSKNPDQPSYNDGTLVTLTATASTGFQFDHWEGDANGTTNPIVITMNSNKTISAVFIPIAPATYTLTVNATNGTVTKNPDQSSYNDGTSVTLTATASTDFQFDHWEGDANGTTNPINVTMNSNKIISAVFTPIAPATYTLTVNATNGTVTKNPDQPSYNDGTVITLTATANTGFQFDHWEGDANGTTNPITVTMNTNKTISPVFIATTATQYVLTIEPVDVGTVTKSPDQSTYNAGTNVVLTAIPKDGYAFYGWYGGTGGSENPVTITMTQNYYIIPLFTELPKIYTLTVNQGTGSGTYNEGDEISISANDPPAHQEFDRWSGNISGIQDPLSAITTITMPGANVAVTAIFKNIDVPDQTLEDDIPKFFSPNQDGIGDTWEWENIESYQGCKIVVFTRSGREVYSAYPYDNSWAGTSRNGILPSGDYYYLMTCEDGSSRKGAVRILNH